MKLTENLWNRRETAEFLGVSVATLHRWNQRGQGPLPMYLVVNRRPFWVPADVRSWAAGLGVLR